MLKNTVNAVDTFEHITIHRSHTFNAKYLLTICDHRHVLIAHYIAEKKCSWLNIFEWVWFSNKSNFFLYRRANIFIFPPKKLWNMSYDAIWRRKIILSVLFILLFFHTYLNIFFKVMFCWLFLYRIYLLQFSKSKIEKEIDDFFSFKKLRSYYKWGSFDDFFFS